MWVKLDDSFFEHRKVMILSVRAKLLFLAGLTHAAKNLTDGYLLDGDVRVIRAFAEATPAHVRELVDAKLWERDGRGYSIHDWSDYNPSAEAVLAKRAAKVEAGRAGGQASAAARAQAKGQAKSNPRNPYPVTRNPYPEPPPAAASDPVLSLLSKAYENGLGNLSVGVEDELRDWSERIPANGRGEKCIEYAFREAAAQNHRSWSYVAAILTRLEAEGWPAEPEVVAPPGKVEAAWLERRYQRGKA